MVLPRVLTIPARQGQDFIDRCVVAVSTASGEVRPRQWLKIIGALLILAGLTLGFSRLAHLAISLVPTETSGTAILCLGVFTIFLAANASVMVPVPITMPVIIAAALQGNPLLIGLAAGAGSAVGECGGYIMGRLGHNMLIPDGFLCRLNRRFTRSNLEHDVKKHGPLAIGILAAQPILPFDIAGLIAGSLKMNFHAFFFPLLGGRAAKYVVIAYLAGVLGYIPFFR